MKAIKGELQSLKKLQKQFIKEQAKQEKQDFEHKKQAAIAQGKIPPISKEDIQFFHQAVRGVTPLADTNRIDRKAAPLKNPEFYRAKREQAEGTPSFSKPKRTKAPASRKVTPSTQRQQEAFHYLAPGIGKDVLTKLRQLSWPIEATLDLHGATLDQATERFDRFVGTCFEHQVKCFMIVHGKGHGSKEGRTVLKQHVAAWLKDFANVLAYLPAPENLGGEGALIVLCKSAYS